MWIRFLTGIAASCLVATGAYAAGPATFATIDRSGWAEPLNTPSAFDTASRAEMLMFAKALLASEALSADQLKVQLGVKEVEMLSVEKVRQRFWQRLAGNYQLASQGCNSAPFCPAIHSVGDLRQAAADFNGAADAKYAAWAQSSARFHQQYLNEQLRLAALFPKISSEIDTVNSQEITGDKLVDRQFLLTFDDGPTAVKGHTDEVATLLRANGLHGSFFVLGAAFEARLQKTSAAAMADLYRDQCVSLHGWEHKSHAQWSEWQSSVTRSATLVSGALPSSYKPLFRPPYGQRRSDSGEFFQAQNIQVMLWGLDSQDWSRPMNADAATQRIQTLMLLWRHGIILFHDIHEKSPKAVPALVAANKSNGVSWADCRSIQ